MVIIRSALSAQVAPGRTPDRASVDELEGRLWRQKRGMLVYADDPHTPGLVRMFLEARAKVRFGS